MKYRINVWQYGRIIEDYYSNDVNEVVKWYRKNWADSYEVGNCTIEVYESDKDMLFNRAVACGFY